MYEQSALQPQTQNIVTKQPQVVEEFDMLEAQVKRNHEIAAAMASRLSGVLRTEPEAATAGQKDEKTLVPAAQRVRVVTYALADLGSFYESLLRRLEI